MIGFASLPRLKGKKGQDAAKDSFNRDSFFNTGLNFLGYYLADWELKDVKIQATYKCFKTKGSR